MTPQHARTFALAACVLPLVGAACDRDGMRGWRCRSLGPAQECVSATKLDLPSAPWTCHEWRGRLLCAAPEAAASPLLRAPWRCRRDAAAGLAVCLRALPPLPGETRKTQAANADPPSWRCALAADGTRRCRPRAFGNAPWECDRGLCVQRYPDLPNRWEWECFEDQGRAICRTMTPDATDAAWACGRLPDDRLVCVNPDPDVPPEGGRWTCRYHEKRDGARHCSPGGATACRQDTECPAGFCLEGRCVLAHLAPRCFFNTDCTHGRCLGGTCIGTTPNPAPPAPPAQVARPG